MKISKRFILITFPILLLFAVYFLGPEPERQHWSDKMPTVPTESTALEGYIRAQESKHVIKPDNEARIVWADTLHKKTEYSVVYLHGFSASQEEGDPVHTDFAKAFGCNLFLARLADHGVDTTEQLLYFTGDRFWESAKEALAIGKAIGNKVIVMSTSTGGTVALMLVAQYPEDVFALINMSPNIAINNSTAFMLNDPWGLQIARQVLGGDYQVINYEPARQQYWNGKYRIESIVQLQEMLEEKMTEQTFRSVTCPSLTMYYYKNEQEQDPTVKVSAMLEMNKLLGTSDNQKQVVAIPGAGFHVLGSHLVSKDIPAVETAAFAFAEGVLGLNRVNQP